MSEGLKKFGWKRKIGSQVSKAASTTFEKDAKDDEDVSLDNRDIDWFTMTPVKKRTTISLEDGKSKAFRLTQEGTVLASSERYYYLPSDY